MQYILVAAGLCLLLFGGEMLVRGAVDLARRLGVSPLVIGLTIVAYGTGAPELLVSLEASLAGSPGIAIGNIVGSNIANILLIVGCSALISPIGCTNSSIKFNGVMMLGATALFIVLGYTGAITPWGALPMLAILVAFTLYSYVSSRKSPEAEKAAEADLDAEGFHSIPVSMPKASAILLAGLACVALGSDLLIAGAVDIARNLGISEATIGLTLVALGTSLPELATAVVAAYRRHSDLALGNVIGSNIFNILGIMGIVPLFGSLAVPAAVVSFDFWVMLGATAIFVGLTAFCVTIGRLIAGLFLFGYLSYIACHYFGISSMVMG